MANICLTCGDKGAVDLLIYCRKCRDSAVHHYCMENVDPDDDNIHWWCWDCAPNERNAGPLRKSECISTKRLKVQSTKRYWKERLNKNKVREWNSNGIYETDKSASEDYLRVANLEIQLFNEIQRDHDIQEDKMSGPEVPIQSDKRDESIRIDEPTLPRESTLPPKEESCLEFFDPTLDSSEPVADPVWRGWFNIEEDSKTGLEILAHLSNKACQKAFAAATAIPIMLDIQLLDKYVVWPKSFLVSPPTAASIALYFFPARDRVEQVFDSLLDEVIERDLALMATIDGLELLIFSSCELPLQHWRYRNKYYLWGVFRKKQQVCLPK